MPPNDSTSCKGKSTSFSLMKILGLSIKISLKKQSNVHKPPKDELSRSEFVENNPVDTSEREKKELTANIKQQLDQIKAEKIRLQELQSKVDRRTAELNKKKAEYKIQQQEDTAKIQEELRKIDADKIQLKGEQSKVDLYAAELNKKIAEYNRGTLDLKQGYRGLQKEIAEFNAQKRESSQDLTTPAPTETTITAPE